MKKGLMLFAIVCCMLLATMHAVTSPEYQPATVVSVESRPLKSAPENAGYMSRFRARARSNFASSGEIPLPGILVRSPINMPVLKVLNR